MTDREKITIYENFLHAINLYKTICDYEKIGKLIDNADRWSYAHRVGNGQYSDEEQQKIIDNATKKLSEF